MIATPGPFSRTVMREIAVAYVLTASRYRGTLAFAYDRQRLSRAIKAVIGRQSDRRTAEDIAHFGLLSRLKNVFRVNLGSLCRSSHCLTKTRQGSPRSRGNPGPTAGPKSFSPPGWLTLAQGAYASPTLATVARSREAVPLESRLEGSARATARRSNGNQEMPTGATLSVRLAAATNSTSSIVSTPRWTSAQMPSHAGGELASNGAVARFGRIGDDSS